MEHLKYPIGKFVYGQNYTEEQTAEHIQNLKEFSTLLNHLCQNLDEDELLKIYRPDSWDIQQLIHHIGESHINAYIRVKLALTEDNPTIKPYKESAWVATPENRLISHTVSLQIIESIHVKLVALLENLTEDELERTYVHPQYMRSFRIRELIALYSWHGPHHIAHIQLALAN